jgi:hypothetical protein
MKPPIPRCCMIAGLHKAATDMRLAIETAEPPQRQREL